MDSYLIVGGVPNANQYHCEDTLNLALGLVYEARQVIVPNIQQPIRVFEFSNTKISIKKFS